MANDYIYIQTVCNNDYAQSVCNSIVIYDPVQIMYVHIALYVKYVQKNVNCFAIQL